MKIPKYSACRPLAHMYVGVADLYLARGVCNLDEHCPLVAQWI